MGRTRAQESTYENPPTALGWLEQLQRLVPAVEGKVVRTTGKMAPSKERTIEPDVGRVSIEKLGDLYDRHAFAVARDEPVEYQKLAENYGLKAELVEQILRHTRKPNIVEKYVDGQPRLVAERDGP